MDREDKRTNHVFKNSQTDINCRIVAKVFTFLAVISLVLCVVSAIADKPLLMLSVFYGSTIGLISMGFPFFYAIHLGKKNITSHPTHENESIMTTPNQCQVFYNQKYYAIQGVLMILINGFIISIIVQSTLMPFYFVLPILAFATFGYSMHCWHRAFTPEIALTINSEGIKHKKKLLLWENIKAFAFKDLDNDESPLLILMFHNFKTPYEIPLCNLKLEFEELRQQIKHYNTNASLKDDGNC